MKSNPTCQCTFPPDRRDCRCRSAGPSFRPSNSIAPGCTRRRGNKSHSPRRRRWACESHCPVDTRDSAARDRTRLECPYRRTQTPVVCTPRVDNTAPYRTFDSTFRHSKCALGRNDTACRYCLANIPEAVKGSKIRCRRRRWCIAKCPRSSRTDRLDRRDRPWDRNNPRSRSPCRRTRCSRASDFCACNKTGPFDIALYCDCARTD